MESFPLLTHATIMFTTVMIAFVFLWHFIPFLAIAIIVLIPALFILYYSKPSVLSEEIKE